MRFVPPCPSKAPGGKVVLGFWPLNWVWKFRFVKLGLTTPSGERIWLSFTLPAKVRFFCPLGAGVLELLAWGCVWA